MDSYYMNIALDLAKMGRGKVNPNPLVGAIIVKDGKIIGRGFHEKYGEAHAEVNALKNAKEDVEGATMYVTLEPCSHYGKTPPCADRIIESKLSRVVIGMVDVNPLVSGNGVRKLQSAGISVTIGVLKDECKKLNEVFIKYITMKEPFVVLKSGMSLDGKISTYSGESKWITGEEARRDVHNLRSDLTAIMVGINTVIMDNPQLTCRVQGGRNPIRIIVDSTLRIPRECEILKNASEIKTIIAITENANQDKVNYLEELGVAVIRTKSINRKVNLKELMGKLASKNIDSILLEGGATLNYSALESGIVDKVIMYISPKIIGGEKSKTPVGGRGIEVLKDAFNIQALTTSIIGDDILLQGYIERGES
ncbi:MAG: bifunctional diaminohydroxyphosphoribosylaminopyrimidine deaminase/5-amino-6-(5-phosphoribosylamino)uracil reductase RibD [Clostridium sp.]